MNYKDFTNDTLSQIMLECFARNLEPSNAPEIIADVVEKRFNFVATFERATIAAWLRSRIPDCDEKSNFAQLIENFAYSIEHGAASNLEEI